jgi:hypothetical protein
MTPTTDPHAMGCGRDLRRQISSIVSSPVTAEIMPLDRLRVYASGEDASLCSSFCESRLGAEIDVHSEIRFGREIGFDDVRNRSEMTLDRACQRPRAGGP